MKYCREDYILRESIWPKPKKRSIIVWRFATWFWIVRDGSEIFDKISSDYVGVIDKEVFK